METKELLSKKCVPCEGKEKPLSKTEIETFKDSISYKWNLLNNNKIQRQYKLNDFKETMEFVNRIAELAEQEGHHPDLCISYNVLEVTLTTHAIGGLSENDFIIAAKIDEMKS